MHAYTSHKFMPALEMLEDRQLLTGGLIFNAPVSDYYTHPTSGPAVVLYDPNVIDAAKDNGMVDLFRPDGTTYTIGMLPGLPILHSNPGATTTIYLNFTGSRMSADFKYSSSDDPLVAPTENLKDHRHVFDLDGDPTSFNAEEQAVITQVWKYVADDYAPFAVNVTTHSSQPEFGTHESHVEVAIGGPSPVIGGKLIYGRASIGGYSDRHKPNTAFVFSDYIRADAAAYGESAFFADHLASTASHEAGHAFGLEHQAWYNGNDLIDEYHHGFPDLGWAPIMGGSTTMRSLWHNGPNQGVKGQPVPKDEVRFLAYTIPSGTRADDVPEDSARSLRESQPGEFTAAGFIGVNNRDDLSVVDEDWFYFTKTGAGPVHVRVDGPGGHGNLHARLELWSATAGPGWVEQDRLLAERAGSSAVNSVGASWLPAGTYMVKVTSTGGYGNLGTYELRVSASSADGVKPPRSPINTFAGSPTDDVSTVRRVVRTSANTLSNPGSVVPPIAVKVVKRRQVLILDAATCKQKVALFPFGKAFTGKVQVETRDVNSDGILDVICTGRRKGKKVARVYSGLDGSLLPSA